MGAQRTIKVSVELEPGAEPLAGTIQVQDGTPRPFIGWIELTHAIEGARGLQDGAQARED
jgi:hypothetical protein